MKDGDKEPHNEKNKETNEETNEKTNAEPSEMPNEIGKLEGSAVREGEEGGRSEEAEEEKEKPKVKGADQKASQGPTEKEIKKWVEENPWECDYKGCDRGLGGRPYRHHSMGGINLHKYRAHAVGAKKSGEEGEMEEDGEIDMADEVTQRIDRVKLRGEISKAINRIKKLPKDAREVLEVERTMMMDMKTRTYAKDVPLEELQRYDSELNSSIIPEIEEQEAEIKREREEKKASADKKSKRGEDDDADILGYGDMKEELRIMRVRQQLDEARQDREDARRRRDREEQRRDEEHEARMQAYRNHTGHGGYGFGVGNQLMGTSYIQEIEPKYDEEGKIMTDANGQPIIAKARIIPVTPGAPAPRGGGDGGIDALKTLETYHKLTEGDREGSKELIQKLEDNNKAFMDRLEALTNEKVLNKIYGDMGAIAESVKNLKDKVESDNDKDGFTEYLAFEDKLKEHNISRSGETPETKKIDLEIQREKSRRAMDLTIMNKGFKIIETGIKQVTSGPIAKAAARKIDQADIIAEEEEPPSDEEMEEEIDQEIEEELSQEQQPEKKPRGRSARGKKKKR
jgi:hypothetical protein